MSLSFPESFKKSMRDLLGEEDYDLFEKSYSEDAVTSLRINPLKRKTPESEDIVSLMNLKSVSYDENGYYFDASAVPGRRPFHDAGVYYIQDPGAMIPGALLDHILFERGHEFGMHDPEGLRILDLCAAPGGKSTQIASAMKGRGILFSNEINKNRAEILSSNIERMGITNAIVLNESPEKLSERFENHFDAVIVDAPCSGEGMFRKDPDAVKEWSEENVRICTERQRSILEEAYKMLRPGGIMIYSTCTFERSENEDEVLGLISRHSDISVVNVSGFKNKINGYSDGLEGLPDAIRLWPMRFEGEGQFAAALVKAGSSERTLPFGGYESASKIKNTKPLEECLKSCLNDEKASEILDAKDRFRLFGDNLYLMPKDAPSLSGLKVLRCGLHLGEFKKDRFEPSHSLALSIGEEDAKLFKRVSEEEAEQYVKGMTLEGEGNGFCLISVCGYSIGWGKASGGRIKNKYPKGLRIPG